MHLDLSVRDGSPSALSVGLPRAGRARRSIFTYGDALLLRIASCSVGDGQARVALRIFLIAKPPSATGRASVAGRNAVHGAPIVQIDGRRPIARHQDNPRGRRFHARTVISVAGVSEGGAGAPGPRKARFGRRGRPGG